MRGMETVWVPGMDHAGIATQVMVEKRLWSAKRQTRHDLGRDAFEKEIWRWKHENAGTIGRRNKNIDDSMPFTSVFSSRTKHFSCMIAYLTE